MCAVVTTTDALTTVHPATWACPVFGETDGTCRVNSFAAPEPLHAHEERGPLCVLGTGDQL